MNKRRASREKKQAESKGAPTQDDGRSLSASMEALFVILLIFGATGIRLGNFKFSTVEHFDEGVYASNLWFDASSNFQYPMRYLYAPSLLPALIEGTMVLVGRASGLAAIVPSYVAGCITVGLVWWVTRRWFGPAAAVASALLITFSDVHAVFSRAALTDSLLLMFIVTSLGLFERACSSRRLTDFVVAGAVIGLGWWTKYNGWLPLVICAAALIIRFLLEPASRAGSRRLAIGWVLSAATAMVVWSPYLYSLQPYGGYAQVAANHRQYLAGLSGWLASLEQQVANLRYVDSFTGSLGFGAAVMAAWFVRRVSSFRESRESAITRYEVGLALATSAVAVLAATWIGSSVLCLLLGVWSVVPFLRDCFIRRQPTEKGTSGYGKWIHASWLMILFVLTPLYTPFLRLILPLLCGTWLASGRTIDSLAAWSQAVSRRDHSIAPARRKELLAWSIFLVACIGIVWTALHKPLTPYVWRDDRRGLESVAAQIDRLARSNPTTRHSDLEQHSVIYVYGEPALLFHLRAAGQRLVLPVNSVPSQPVSISGQSIATYLVCGFHAMRDRGFREELGAASDRLEPIQTFPYQPSSLVLLDHYHPRDLARLAPSAEVRLYRIRSNR